MYFTCVGNTFSIFTGYLYKSPKVHETTSIYVYKSLIITLSLPEVLIRQFCPYSVALTQTKTSLFPSHT